MTPDHPGGRDAEDDIFERILARVRPGERGRLLDRRSETVDNALAVLSAVSGRRLDAFQRSQLARSSEFDRRLDEMAAASRRSLAPGPTRMNTPTRRRSSVDRDSVDQDVERATSESPHFEQLRRLIEQDPAGPP